MTGRSPIASGVGFSRRRSYAAAVDRALLLDEDRDDHLDGGRIVAWYRVDPTPRILRVLALGAAVMTIGSVVMASAFRELGHSPVDFADQRALWIAFGIGGAGLTTIVSGVTSTATSSITGSSVMG